MMRRIFERATETYGAIEWRAWKAWRWLARYWGWILLIVLIAAGFLTWFFWDVLAQWIDCLWTWSRADASGDSKTETLRNLVWAIGGGGAAGFGLLLAFWRSGLAHLQAKTAERGLNNERYQKGTDMLGSATLATRIGGVYALETLAQERPYDYHIQIAKVLCAFIRHPADHDQSGTEVANGEVVKKPCSPAIQAAAQVLGKRSRKQIRIERREAFQLKIWYSHLLRASLHGVNFSGADLRGVNFSGAGLHRADFSDAWPIKANLAGAHMYGANLSGANLSGVTLKDTNLSNAKLDKVKNLTQTQLDDAFIWEDCSPPTLVDAVDPETCKPLKWQGEVRRHPPRLRPQPSQRGTPHAPEKTAD